MVIYHGRIRKKSFNISKFWDIPAIPNHVEFWKRHVLSSSDIHPMAYGMHMGEW